jgi:transcriptional regulator with XRE-family HTH domain
MQDERTERHRQIRAIKNEAKSLNGGRSYLLQGLRACRLAAGLTQRQLAAMIGSNQSTVRQLEREYRGAYPKTIQRLCNALEVTPEDLLCGGSYKQEEAHR